MTVCSVCRGLKADVILLRTGEYVCGACIRDLEQGVTEYEQQISDLWRREELSRNDRDAWEVSKVVLLVLFGLLAFFALSSSWLLALGFALCGFYLCDRVSIIARKRKRRLYEERNAELSQLQRAENDLIDKREAVYRYFWEIPPDWSWRRQQVRQRDEYACTSCGRGECGNIPFHVHHIVPKSKIEGHHGLDNLTYLCEICHGECEGHGHHLIKEARKERLKQEKSK